MIPYTGRYNIRCSNDEAGREKRWRDRGICRKKKYPCCCVALLPDRPTDHPSTTHHIMHGVFIIYIYIIYDMIYIYIIHM